MCGARTSPSGITWSLCSDCHNKVLYWRAFGENWKGLWSMFVRLRKNRLNALKASFCKWLGWLKWEEIFDPVKMFFLKMRHIQAFFVSFKLYTCNMQGFCRNIYLKKRPRVRPRLLSQAASPLRRCTKTINRPKSKLNMLLRKADMTINSDLKINWACCFGLPFAVSQCVVAVWPKVLLAVCVHWITFSPCWAAPAAAEFTFLHSQDHARTTKIYKGQNKNILSSVIAGQTSVSLLDCIFALQQIASDKRRGAANKCLQSARALMISYWHSLGFTDCTWPTMTSTLPLAIR